MSSTHERPPLSERQAQVREALPTPERMELLEDVLSDVASEVDRIEGDLDGLAGRHGQDSDALAVVTADTLGRVTAFADSLSSAASSVVEYAESIRQAILAAYNEGNERLTREEQVARLDRVAAALEADYRNRRDYLLRLASKPNGDDERRAA